MTPQRPDGRNAGDLRQIHIETKPSMHAEGSALVRWGNTHVWCTASVGDGVPAFRRGSGMGWVTAEYGMLPRSTDQRNGRSRNMESGRTREISRLIGRSLRSTIDAQLLGERQIRLDCDVLNADGGTRVASLIGGHLALRLAVRCLMDSGDIAQSPFLRFLSAVSIGVWHGDIIVDPCYHEDSQSDVDGTLVADEDGNLLEIQFTAEHGVLSTASLTKVLERAQPALTRIREAQHRALESAAAASLGP